MFRPLLIAFLLLMASSVFAAEPLTGEQIYRQQCAKCHGAAGEGVKEFFPRPLVGDRSPAQLATLIAKTMPEDKPGTCVGPDAMHVSLYIHDTFYSTAARERNKPPRVELSHLTVRQYRHTVADLIGSFRAPVKMDERQGLKGEYFNARNFQANKRMIDRIDPEVRFDFGKAGPNDKFDAHQFCIRWEGSVIPPETGDYEFVIRTEHALRLWVNDLGRPLIDAWVKSGTDTEFRGSLYLIGGRAYSLRLEFSKAKQGVDDSKKNPNPPSLPASISLNWKPPQRALEVIPQRNLMPNRFPEIFVVTTPFPPDDRSLGWERGTAVSKAWDQATTDAAIETAGYVGKKLNELAGTKDDAADRNAKLREFCKKFVERAFRRPLTEEQRVLFIDRQFAAVTDSDAAVKRVVLLALKSPRFLYREVGSPDGYETAAKLSFALWDALPDAELIKAATDGKLKTREEIAKQAERMLADPRARAKLRDFFMVWLKVERVPDLAKDAKRFPGFDPAIAADLRTSLELLIDEVISKNGSDFRRILLDDQLYLNGRLAKFYGIELPAEAPFQKVKLNSEKRSGVLTHPYLMANLAYSGSSSPIHRGVFLARDVLGLSMRPPPDAFTPLPEDLHPKLTTRERIALQTKPAACISCHGIINPLGFTLENFDAVGRYREKENDKKIDATGSYLTRAGETVKFARVKELGKYLAASEEVHAAFAEQLFHHLIQQPVRAYGPQKLEELRKSFAASEFNVRKLAAEIAVTAALPAKK